MPDHAGRVVDEASLAERPALGGCRKAARSAWDQPASRCAASAGRRGGDSRLTPADGDGEAGPAVREDDLVEASTPSVAVERGLHCRATSQRRSLRGASVRKRSATRRRPQWLRCSAARSVGGGRRLEPQRRGRARPARRAFSRSAREGGRADVPGRRVPSARSRPGRSTLVEEPSEEHPAATSMASPPATGRSALLIRSPRSSCAVALDERAGDHTSVSPPGGALSRGAYDVPSPGRSRPNMPPSVR